MPEGDRPAVHLPAAAKPSYGTYRRVGARYGELDGDLVTNPRVVAGGSGETRGIYTHRVLFLRDPVQQYLSVRMKPWCANCGGFLRKMAAQEGLLRACLSAAGRARAGDATLRSACPFDMVIFDRDIFAALGRGELPQLLAQLGLLPSGRLLANLLNQSTAAHSSRTGGGDGGGGSPVRLRVRERMRRARNVALGLPPRLVNRGNMQGDSLRPRLAARRRSWSCSVASRARRLLPTLCGLSSTLRSHCCRDPWTDPSPASDPNFKPPSPK